MNVAILGSGTWARALATLTAEAGHQPVIGYRGKPLSGFKGSPNLVGVVQDADLVIISEPVTELRSIVREAKPGPSDRVVIASRGIEPSTGRWATDTVTGESACVRVGALAGPLLASEVLAGRPSAMVVASRFDDVVLEAQQALHSRLCRVYTSKDLVGVELAGAVVDVLAAALGLADSLDLGIGIRGVIVTRGIAEAARLGEAIGADPRTLSGLAGVGDLVSCASHPDHPSFALGRLLGKGRSPSETLRAEATALVELGRRHQVELPLVDIVSQVAAGGVEPRLALDMLMRRGATSEV